MKITYFNFNIFIEIIIALEIYLDTIEFIKEIILFLIK